MRWGTFGAVRSRKGVDWRALEPVGVAWLLLPIQMKKVACSVPCISPLESIRRLKLGGRHKHATTVNLTEKRLECDSWARETVD